MRKLFPLFIIVVFFGCSKSPEAESSLIEKGPSNILGNLTYSIDTVLVDAGENLLNLKDVTTFGKRNYFSINQNQSLLYFFDRHGLILNEIDINSLKLINSFPFELEGPNGIGRFVYSFRYLPNGNFYGRDLFGNAWFYSKEGKKLSEINFNGEVLQGFNLDLNLANQLLVDLTRDKLYSLPIHIKNEKILLAIMDSSGHKGEILELPQLEKVNDYKIDLNIGKEGGEGKREQLFLQQPKDQVLISSTVGNAIYIYNPDLDCLIYLEFPHKLVPAGKEMGVKKEVFSRNEFLAETAKLHTQINYYDFYWDDRTQRYYRFASIGLPLTNIDSPKKFEYYMFAYDQAFNLIGETKLNDLSEIPIGAFFKDGKLWAYVNIEDELGFAVFTFDF